MTCFYCKGNIESSTTTYMTDYQGCYIIIKNVPCEKCSQCGEEYLNGETLERIEEIIQKVKGMLTEIAVVDSRFYQCNRGVVINLEHAVDFDGTGFRLDNGSNVSVSRKLLKNARQTFMEFLFQRRS